MWRYRKSRSPSLGIIHKAICYRPRAIVRHSACCAREGRDKAHLAGLARGGLCRGGSFRGRPKLALSLQGAHSQLHHGALLAQLRGSFLRQPAPPHLLQIPRMPGVRTKVASNIFPHSLLSSIPLRDKKIDGPGSSLISLHVQIDPTVTLLEFLNRAPSTVCPRQLARSTSYSL